MKRPADSRSFVHRLVTVFAACLALAGCSVIDGLGGGDGNGGMDIPDPPDPGVPVCANGGASSFVTAELTDPNMAMFLEDVAIVSEVQDAGGNGRFTLDMNNGQSFSFSYTLVPGDVLPLRSGDPVRAFVHIEMPFWIETTVAVYTVDATGGNQDQLIAALWDNSGLELVPEALRGLPASYVPESCAPFNDGCGDRVPLSLDIAVDGSGQLIRVPAGATSDTGPFRIVNSVTSGEFVGPIECTDTPMRWTAGYVLATQ